jgi:hypothetical protein
MTASPFPSFRVHALSSRGDSLEMQAVLINELKIETSACHLPLRTALMHEERNSSSSTSLLRCRLVVGRVG